MSSLKRVYSALVIFSECNIDNVAMSDDDDDEDAGHNNNNHTEDVCNILPMYVVKWWCKCISAVLSVISVSISRAVAATAAGPSVHVAAVSGG